MEYLTVPTKHYLVFLSIFLSIPLLAVTKVVNTNHIKNSAAIEKPEEIGLYDSSDKVRILNVANFQSEVLNKNHSILVEFYNSYCGHCRKFAPSYKQLAENLYGWSDVLPVSAFDCAVEENNDICREYEVMGYPTLRYFGPAYQPSADNYGKEIRSQQLNVITSALAQFIAAENKTSNMSSWPDFQTVQSSSAASLFEGLNNVTKYIILVYEPENSTVGIETILNFARYPNIAVKRITDLELAGKYQINGNLYKIATINRQGSVVPYTTNNENSVAYKETIKSFLNAENITERPKLKTETTTTKQLETFTEGNSKVDEIIKEVKRNKHLVYKADLEMAIRNMLHKEIPRSSHINGEKLVALQKFMTVLERYNPLDSSGRLMISQLAAFVSQHNQELLGVNFKNEMLKLEKQYEQPIYTSTHYVGCAGSQPHFRGFTCSLWQLFHFMSVQAANLDKSEDPLEVLQAVHGYVKYFFGCTDCSQHFQEMAATLKIWNTSTKDEAVLWLWAAHNVVNKRLSGDDTEDPKFPKIEFPAKSSCSQCYKPSESDTVLANSDDKWNKAHVLQFLKNIHNPQYVSHYGLPNYSLPLPTPEKMRHKRMISNAFSDMDMGMGMLLYAFCIIMLVLAFKLFAFKGGYRRKPYGHEVLGKV